MAVTVERLEAEVEVDPSKAIAGLSALNAAISAVTRDHRATIDVDVDRSVGNTERASDSMGEFARRTREASSAATALGGAGGGATRAMGSLGQAAFGAGRSMRVFGTSLPILGGLLALVAGAIPYLISLINTLGGALIGLVAAIAPLTGLLATLPGMLLGLGGGLMAAIAGFSGVGAAMKAQDAAAKAVTSSTRGVGASARNAAQEARNMAAAERGLEQAVRGVIRAQKDLKRAQDDVGKAREQAAENIEEAGWNVKEAIWAEEEATIALKEAQENLARAQQRSSKSSAVLSKETDEFTGKVYEVARVSADAVDETDNMEDAQRAVIRAERDLQRAKRRTNEAQEESNELQAKGVENSDLVVDALQRVEDAQYALIAANDNVVASQERIASAAERIETGQAGGAAATLALQQAMANLTEEGRSFVRFMNDEMEPAWKRVKDAAQSALLPPIERGLRDVLGLMPMLEEHAAGFAGTLGTAIEDFLSRLASPEGAGQLDRVLGSANRVLGHMLDGADALGRLFLTVADAASPLTEWFTEALADKVTGWADRLDEMAKDGELKSYFEDVRETASKVSELFGNIWGSISGIVEAAAPLGGWILDALIGITDEWDTWINSEEGQERLRGWFEDLREPIKKVWGFLEDIVGEMLTIGEEGNPVMEDFSAIVGDLSDALPGVVQMMRDFGTIIRPIAEAIEIIAAAWEGIKDIGTLGGLLDTDYEPPRVSKPFTSPQPKRRVTPKTYSLPKTPSYTSKSRYQSARATGGHVQEDKPYLVGERRPEVFIPETSGRILPRVPNTRDGLAELNAGGGLTEQQLESLLKRVLDGVKPDIDIEQHFYEDADPRLISADLAWRLS